MLNLILQFRKTLALTLSLFLVSLKLFSQHQGLEAQGPPDNSVFPLFDYVTIDGDSISSDDLSDKLLVINIWFVGCTGCKQEEPYLKSITEHYEGAQDIVFLGFCMSKPDKIRRYLERNGEIGYSNISLDRKEVNEKYGVEMSPTHFLIKNGILMAKYTGPITPQINSLKWFQDEISKLKN